jgi:hypothetical protein
MDFFFIRLVESFGSGKSTTSFRSSKEGRILEISVAQDSGLVATIWAKIKEILGSCPSIHGIHLYLLLPSFLLFRELTFSTHVL